MAAFRPRASRWVLAVILLALPAAGAAVLPLLALMGKQVVQDMVVGALKGHLIASLAGMGCKGARLAGILATVDVPHGGVGGLAGMAGMPAGMPSGMPAGMPSAMPAGMPSGMRSGMPAGAMPPGMPAGAVAGGAVRPGAMASGAGAPDMSQMMAMMQARGGAGMTPEQMARTQEAMARMQKAMEHPLTRPQTLAVFEELAAMGLLTDDMHAEARDCILLAPAGSDRELGQAGAMFQEVLLPQLRETKAKLAALGPAEQDQLAQGIAEALREAKPADRKSFEEGLGLGFFPRGVVEKVRAAAR